MAAKRRRNLALVWRRANSGSTLSRRARLTMVKSMSPTSETMASWAPGGGVGGWSRMAWRSSSVSSSSLAKMPSTSGQSKPLFARAATQLGGFQSEGRERGMLSSAEDAAAAPSSLPA